jgi:hypothetical protein
MLTTGVIHEEPGNWRRPILEHTNKATFRNMLRDLLFECEPQAGASECGLNHQVGIIDDERAIHADRDRLPSLLEFPPVWTARKTQAYASMVI